MGELLTTRELQNLLKVDRITIYRMLEQGRLPGFKVGGQWRFSRREIEEWLEAQRDALALADEAAAVPTPVPVPLPLRCVQNVQDVFAEALDIAAVTTDLAGNPLTRLSHPCAFCDAILSSAEGRRRCAETWRAGASASSPLVRPCHAGLACISVPVRVGGSPVAVFSACQFAEANGAGDGRTPDLRRLAAELGLDEADLVARWAAVRVLGPSDVSRVARLVQRMSVTLAEIGDERLALLGRLERIAEMTRV
ncbi:MAG: PocR ligand-binding domain-containing protein [Anaerolineae bacterium]|nr:PocR ligand-binding domain-containing protein [Anaerolineae bacterium]